MPTSVRTLLNLRDKDTEAEIAYQQRVNSRRAVARCGGRRLGCCVYVAVYVVLHGSSVWGGGVGGVSHLT